MYKTLIKSMLVLVVISLNQVSVAQIQSSKSRIKINNLPPQKDTTVIKLIAPDMTEEKTLITTEASISIAGLVESKDSGYVVVINGEVVALDNNFFHKDLEIPIGPSSIKISLLKSGETINEYYYNLFVPKPTVILAGETLRPGKYYALIIGIDSYPKMNVNLDNAVRDATAVYDLLSRKYLFEKENMQLLIDPTREDLINTFENLAAKVKGNDNLLIFYAGHGQWDKDYELGYWLPSDASYTSRAAWFQNSSLANYLKVIKSKHTLLVSDACFSGSIFKTRSVREKIPDDFEEIYKLPSRKAITSGTLSEVPDESIFIKYFLDRLENNTDKYLSSESLFARLRVAVENNNTDKPRMGVIQGVGDEGGDFIFIRRDDR